MRKLDKQPPAHGCVYKTHGTRKIQRFASASSDKVAWSYASSPSHHHHSLFADPFLARSPSGTVYPIYCSTSPFHYVYCYQKILLGMRTGYASWFYYFFKPVTACAYFTAYVCTCRPVHGSCLRVDVNLLLLGQQVVLGRPQQLTSRRKLLLFNTYSVEGTR
jgi:hypothetical protein